MAIDPSEQPPEPKPQLQLASGEVVFARWPHIALEHGMLAQQLWLRGEAGALRVDERPADWNGDASWWLPGKDRRAGLLALLPELMRWLPPSVDAPGKLQVAERMPFPEQRFGRDRWDDNDLDGRPFVDAVFVDDAAHLHLVDVASVGDGDAFGAFSRWQDCLRFRRLEHYWLHPGDPGSRFEAEYCKLCWTRRQSPLEGICSLIDSHGDELPYRTVETFWQWVGRRCLAYWGKDRHYGYRHGAHATLLTDGGMPADEQLFERNPYGNATLACATPFVVDGSTWIRLDVRSWGALGEQVALAEDRVCRMAGATDIGKRRTANQDAVRWHEEEGWAAVADGMGGHPNGDVASATVLKVFNDAMHQWPDEQAPHRRRTVAQRLRRAAAEAHAELWKENEGKSIFGRMGTTLCALRLHGDELSIVHSGDSRIYEFNWSFSFDREPRLRRLTVDHGEGGGLDRALGLWERVPVDMDTMPIRDDGFYLLCSDGLTNMVSDGEIQRLCLEHVGKGGADTDLQALVDALIDAANEAGGNDNISVCLVEAKRQAEAT